jgi:predicted nucleotidyltransferase
MRTPSPPLLPLLRSRAQGDLLALLYLHPEREYSLTEAANLIGVSVKTVHTEASRLVTAGFASDSRRGNVRLLRAVTATPVSRPLTDLLAVTYGPLPVLTDLLADFPGVSAAFIYGSWAARYHGEPGPVPQDIDLLVVGTADRDDLDEIARAAQDKLGRPVAIRRISPAAWAAPDPDDPFLASIRQRPLVEIQLSGPRR